MSPNVPSEQRTQFYQRRWFIVTTSIFALFGTPFGIWSYIVNIRLPAITYEVAPLRTILVQSGAPTDLSVQFKGSPITKGVVSVSIGIWNAGREPVRSNDVLEAIHLKIGAGRKVLSARVARQSRAIVQFQLYNAAAALGALETRPLDSLDIKFNILEHNDSAILQVIYEGDVADEIVLSGIFVGQPKLRRLSQDDLRPSVGDRPGRDLVTFISTTSSFLTMGLSLLSTRMRREKIPWWMWLPAAVCLLSYIYSIWLIVDRYLISVPPFQFPG